MRWIKRVFCWNHLSSEQPTQSSGIQIAALEWLVGEMFDQGGHESRIRPPVRWPAVLVALAPGQGRDALGIGPAQRELEIGARKTAGKAAVFGHIGKRRHDQNHLRELPRNSVYSWPNFSRR